MCTSSGSRLSAMCDLVGVLYLVQMCTRGGSRLSAMRVLGVVVDLVQCVY